jgi:hypothetical protein
MELTYVTIVVLASLIFIISGMVGYLYWQQTHMLQHIQSLAMALGSVAEQLRVPEPEPEPVHVTKEDEDEDDGVAEQSHDEVGRSAEQSDDRVSVKESVEVVEGPPKTATTVAEDDTDDLHDKTAQELRDLLTKKGIPFGKRDSKSVLLQVLKATA